MEDSRFSHIKKDPRFRLMKKKERKVKIDKRFNAMFEDKRFKLTYTVDKRGRPVKTTTSDDLMRFYELSDSESENEEELEEKKTKKKKKKIKGSEETESVSGSKETDRNVQEKKDVDIKKINVEDSSDEQEVVTSSGDNEEDSSDDQEVATSSGDNVEDSSDDQEVATSSDDNEDFSSDNQKVATSSGEEDSDEEVESDNDAAKKPEPKTIDLARGEGNIETSSSEDESSEEESDTEFDHGWGEFDKDAPVAEDASRRLALCNMDWDRIKATDILVLLNSFTPTGGTIVSVTIYPSEYGLERMKEEDMKGPKELTQSDKSNNVEAFQYHRERLRQYQLNRLKYYYAIVECDSVQTANHLYSECDGVEYESSAARLDLRFVPDDMTFEQTPKDVAKDTSVTYQPNIFHSSALQQSHVNLTWDETDPKRLEMMSKKYTKDDLDDLNVDDYLASDSGDEDAYAGLEAPEFGEVTSSDEDEDEQIDKYRKLLLGKEQHDKDKEEKDIEMEITWEPGLKESTQKIVENKRKDEKSVTPWQEYLEKKKEKRLQKRLEKQNPNRSKQQGEEEQAFSDDDLPEGVDLNDDFFKDEIQGQGSKLKSNKKKGRQVETENKEQQDELNLLTLDEDDSKEHFNLKKIMRAESKSGKKKRKKNIEEEKGPEGSFEVNVKDSRFSALYNTPAFNIDPSSQEFKKTKAMDAIISEKIRRRELEEAMPPGAKKAKTKIRSSDVTNKTEHNDPALALLVKSVKAKTQSLKQKKKR